MPTAAPVMIARIIAIPFFMRASYLLRGKS
jgi:hypothetical protein